MAVLKPCKSKGCKASPRCEHPWWFDLMHKGRRYRMPVDAFALTRGATQPVTSKQEAGKTWEPKFIGAIVAGRDPRKPPAPPTQAGLTVATFLDSYYDRYVVAESLRSVASIRSRLAALKAFLGELPVSELERVDQTSSGCTPRRNRRPPSTARWPSCDMRSTGDGAGRRRSSPGRRSTDSASRS